MHKLKGEVMPQVRAHRRQHPRLSDTTKTCFGSRFVCLIQPVAGQGTVVVATAAWLVVLHAAAQAD